MTNNTPPVTSGAQVVASKGFRRHVVVLLLGLVTYFGFAASINYWMDPWEIFHPTRYSAAPSWVKTERITLAHNIRNAAPFDVLLLGSSRIRYLVVDGGPRNPDVSITAPYFGDKNVYNAALAGSNIYQMRRILEHALHYHPVKEMVLLLDDVMMNTHRPLGNGWQEFNYYGSPSFQTDLERWLSLVDFAMLKETAGFILEAQTKSAQGGAPTSDGLNNVWTSGLGEFTRRDLYGCFEIDARTRGELDRILSIAKEQGIRVTLISSFIHPALFEYSYRSDNGLSQRNYLTLVRELAIKHQVPAWLFSPYSAITSGSPHRSYALEEFKSSPDFFDPGHANAQIGRKMLDLALKDQASPDLNGYRLNDISMDNLLNELERQRSNRLQKQDILFMDYVKEHPIKARQACSTRSEPKL